MMKFFHGTSDIFNINKILPSSQTQILREEWRKNNQDIVFVTSSLYSAKRYAKKSAEKFGGSPVVYIVKPINWSPRHGNEYVCDWAMILEKVEEKPKSLRALV